MSVHPTTIIRSSKLAIAGSIVASLAFTGVAAADQTVTVVKGNPSCAALGAGYEEVKVEPVRQGHTAFGDGTISGTIDVTGVYFDWSVPAGVDAVIVKGGPDGNVYTAGDEMTAGTRLHAPINPDNGRPFGLSHIAFCSDGVDSPPKPAPGPCEPGGAATMPDGTPCGQPAPAPQGEVLGTRASSPASAQMSGPSACVSRKFRQVLRGTGIRRVTLAVNGRRVRTFAGGKSRYAITINPRNYRRGVIKVRARVTFDAASGKRPQTFRATVLACASNARDDRPAFTG